MKSRFAPALDDIRGIWRLASDDHAGVSVVAALCAIPLIGMLGLAVELGNAYSAKAANQSTADIAALSAALAYLHSNDRAKTTKIASDIAVAGGYMASSVTASIVPSPNDATREAVRVDIRTEEPVLLGQVLGQDPTIPVTSSSFVELRGTAAACIFALNASSGGVDLSTSAEIRAENCGVASNYDVEASTSASLLAESIITSGTVNTSTSGLVATSPDANQIHQNVAEAAIDPYEGFAPLAAEFAKIGNAENPSTPSVPSGSDFNVPNSGSSFVFQGHTIVKTGGVWTAPPGTYNIKKLNLSSSKKLTFTGTSLSPTTITFSGNVTVSTSSKLTIGHGDILSTGKLQASTSATIEIGDGRHYFKSISTSTSGRIDIGDGDLDVQDSVSASTSTAVTIGQGDKKIGSKASVGTSADLILGDGELSIGDDVSVGTSGTLVFGSTPEIYIDGDIELATSADVTYGAGRYYIDGNFDASTSALFTASNVSIFLSGFIDVSTSGGSVLRPPSSDGNVDIDGILFATLSTKASTISTSGSVSISGMFYLPNAALDLSTSGSLNSGSECLMIVADRVEASTSGRLNTNCPDLSDDFSNLELALVQ